MTDKLIEKFAQDIAAACNEYCAECKKVKDISSPDGFAYLADSIMSVHASCMVSWINKQINMNLSMEDKVSWTQAIENTWREMGKEFSMKQHPELYYLDKIRKMLTPSQN